MTTNDSEFDEGQPTIVITFGDDVGTFSAHRFANQFLLAKHLDDVILTGGVQAVIGAVTLVTDQVLPDDRAKLEQFLYRHGRDDMFVAALYEGLSKCWRGETLLPFEQSSESSGTISTPPTDSPSTDDSPSQGMLVSASEPGES